MIILQIAIISLNKAWLRSSRCLLKMTNDSISHDRSRCGRSKPPSSVGLWLLPSPQRCEINVLKLTGLSPSSPRQLSYGYQNWESGDIINLNQSSGHARTLGYQDGDFCQPQLWKHRFTLDTRGSRSPFPLTSEEEDKPKLITKKQDSERGFLQLKESIPLS